MSSVICKQCGRENRSHFKFCLGCGVELNKDNVIVKPEATIPPVMPPPPEPSHKIASAPTMAATPGSELAEYLKSQGIAIPESSRPAAPAAPPPAMTPPPFAAPPAPMAPMAPPMAPPPFAAPMAPPAMTPPPAASPFAPPMAAPPPAASPFAAPMAPMAPPMAPPAAPVEDRSDELPFAAPPAAPAPPAPAAPAAPAHGGFEMADTVCADDDQQALIAPKPVAAPGQKICSQCGSTITPGFKFCGNCGSPAMIDAPLAAPSLDSTLPAPAPFVAPPPQAQAPVPVARLIVQRPDGSTAPVIDMFEGETILGRTSHAAFANDYYMSPAHCKLTIDSGSIFVEDLGSLNGTFFRLSREELLHDGDVFRVGTEVLRYRALPPVEALDDGTIPAGSPNLEAWGRLELIMGKDAPGQAFTLTGERIRIGREEGDITFPDDGYVSGEHLEVTRMDNASYLIDLNSSNGTYLNIKTMMELDPATPILMGYQLYRIELL